MDDLATRAKKALSTRFRELFPSVTVDEDGYVPNPEQNLMDAGWMTLIQKDFEQGSGNELHGKFRAVHSSAALAANHFGRFKANLTPLVLLGRRDFQSLAFEQQLRTGLPGTPPNVDVFLTARDAIVSVESKLTETFSLKKAEFSASYKRDKFPDCEDQWWSYVEEGPSTPERFLDVAQLVKHYLGLTVFLRSHPAIKGASLVYLYWKPTNAEEHEVCRQHEDELHAFAARVASGKIQFVALSYSDLWQEWLTATPLAAHAAALMRRYSISI